MTIISFEGRIKSKAELLVFFSYNRDEGALYWKARGGNFFGWDQRTTKIWDTRYSNRRAGCPHRDGYRYLHCGFLGYVREHRAIWFLEHGEWPLFIDHIDGNPQNNHYANLRDVTIQDNNRNLPIPITNTSGIIGVGTRRKGQWRAVIGVNGRSLCVYTGPSKELAIKARLEAEEKYGFHPNHGRLANATSN